MLVGPDGETLPVPPRMSPLSPPARLVAIEGASGHVAAASADALTTALRLGAHGIWCRVWTSLDGVPVLHQSGRLGGRVRRRMIADTLSTDLPGDVMTLDALLANLHQPTLILEPTGSETSSLDLGIVILQAARSAGVVDRLWMTSNDVDQLRSWRELSAGVRLAHVSRLSALDGGSERHADRLRTAGIDALSLPSPDWNAGQVTMLHRFRREAWATDAQFEPAISRVLDMGIDAVCGRFVDRMVDAAAQIG